VKKLYKNVSVRERDDGYSIYLDERPIKTPAKNDLSLPSESLAVAVADEWRTDEDEIDPSCMKLTRLANTAVDRVSAHCEVVIEEIVTFAETDLVCYRTIEPPELNEKQNRHWEPLLCWLRDEKGIELKSTASVLPLKQSQRDLNAIRDLVASFDVFGLSALHMATSACGSVVLGLAMAFGEIDAITAWEYSLLEETDQINKWGEDPEVMKRRESLRADVIMAARFLDLLCDTT
tara:strand:- start:92 stop:793 length:702 start_codon:yes stop_codon:yes gene_type:complete